MRGCRYWDLWSSLDGGGRADDADRGCVLAGRGDADGEFGLRLDRRGDGRRRGIHRAIAARCAECVGKAARSRRARRSADGHPLSGARRDHAAALISRRCELDLQRRRSVSPARQVQRASGRALFCEGAWARMRYIAAGRWRGRPGSRRSRNGGARDGAGYARMWRLRPRLSTSPPVVAVVRPCLPGAGSS